MTDSGRQKFEHSYDDLAVAALKFISAQSGEHLVKAFAQSRADDIERKANESGAKSSNKTNQLATFLTEQGYAASIETRPMGNSVNIIVLSRTSQQSSRNCAKPKQRLSPEFLELTFNAWQLSLMAMASALPTSPRSLHNLKRKVHRN
jgi:hypothetical protein